ncbi:TPM domain-containing protein [Sphingopyxis sp.]|uniref:TPM domain-containing protein n=1 Tax=Sphingopyxis sp. TaxID=1908224 RepID=UPI002B496D43|nr:TPM domain-containing protein [Sphingopyxis sp.]HJS13308.1 TPM domain-containing protein [Sphingopyxis sp.]
MRFSAFAAPLAILMIAGGCKAAPAPESAVCMGVPKIALQGRITDSANILSAEGEQQLSQRLAAYEQRTTHQMAVATTSALNGADPMEFATCLGRRSGIGNAGRDDGILILIAPNERQSSIAVGYGLEKALTDVEAKAVIKDMIPSFQKSDYASGLRIGIDAIAAQTGDSK